MGLILISFPLLLDYHLEDKLEYRLARPILAPNFYRPRRLHRNRTKYKPGITTSSHGKI
jgi:hypothetical protein